MYWERIRLNVVSLRLCRGVICDGGPATQQAQSPIDVAGLHSTVPAAAKPFNPSTGNLVSRLFQTFVFDSIGFQLKFRFAWFVIACILQIFNKNTIGILMEYSNKKSGYYSRIIGDSYFFKWFNFFVEFIILWIYFNY